MKKIFIVTLALILSGCMTLKISRYIKDESPYQRTYYATFDETLIAVGKALEDTGWTIVESVDPSVYERNQSVTMEKLEQVLMFTEVRQTPMFLLSRYMNINVLLQSHGKSTDVEIRYQSVTPFLFKNIRSHKNDAVVNRVFTRVEELIKIKPDPR